MDSTQKQTILVVEDNENARRLLDTILRSAGYEVTLAPDAEEGLRILEGDAPVDLVLLDLFLPGADGMQFLRLARARWLQSASRRSSWSPPQKTWTPSDRSCASSARSWRYASRSTSRSFSTA